MLYHSILNAKLTVRKKLGRQMCTSNRDDRKLENTVKQKLIQTLGRASQGVTWSWSHQAQTSSGKGLPMPLLKQNHCQKHLTWAKEKKNWYCCSVVQSPLFRLKYILHFISGGSVERHRIHVAWSPVWSFYSQWWFGLLCHLLVLVHCVFWSPQSIAAITF